jgi:hypothetical protein
VQIVNAIIGLLLVFSSCRRCRGSSHACRCRRSARVISRPLRAEAFKAQALKARGFSDALLGLKEQPRLRKALMAVGWREEFRGGRAVVLRRPVNTIGN